MKKIHFQPLVKQHFIIEDKYFCYRSIDSVQRYHDLWKTCYYEILIYYVIASFYQRHNGKSQGTGHDAADGIEDPGNCL